MVNTRKKTYIGSGDESSQPSDTAETPSGTRRSTRRSSSNTASIAGTQTPREVATPLRRSRRLSNSSVESLNDTPVPSKTLSRRSIRSKNTESGDESSDLEVLVIKRRRGAEIKDAPALVPITEEKIELEKTTSPGTVVKHADVTGVKFLLEINKEENKNSPNSIHCKADDTTKSEEPGTSDEKDETNILTVDLRSPPSQLTVCKEESSPTPNDGRISSHSEHSADSFKSCNSPLKEDNSENINLVLETSLDSDEKPTEITENKTANSSSVLETQPISNLTGNSSRETNEPSDGAQRVLKASITGLSVVERLMKIAESKPISTDKRIISVNNITTSKNNLPIGADKLKNIPRGRNKSGRTWKEPKSNPRYLYQDKGLKMGLEKITQLRQERQRIKELETRMKEEKQEKLTELARRRELNKKREEENARRGEVVQVIRNPNKLKRMKKKQLKLIQKRDTTVM